VTTETDWLPVLLGFIPAIVAAVAALLIWRVNRRMFHLQSATTNLQEVMLERQKGTQSLQATMVDLESRPALQIIVEQTPRECPHDPEQSELRWRQLRPEEKFHGLKVTNKGRGPATLKSLNYPGVEDPVSLENAHLPMDVTAFFPAQGLIKALLETDARECFILYADPLGKNHRQYFRINMEHMATVPLRCEDV